MKPFKLVPAFKDYLWGGIKLKTVYGKDTQLNIVAESWELSAHPDGSSMILDGEYAGISFADFVKHHPEFCGKRYDARHAFPILIKFIDANGSLSVQVHPDDAYGFEHEKEPGKTEMWVIMDADPGAFLYYGFEKDITKEEMRSRIQDNTLTEILHKQYVEKGDVVFIPAGTIHAIGAGIMLAEVQQNSNSTYRVYDFGRRGVDGKLRELHIDKALAVTRTDSKKLRAPGANTPKEVSGGSLEILALCDKFTVCRLKLAGEYTFETGEESFVSILCIDGSAVLYGETKVSLGDSVFVPAGKEQHILKGEGEFLLSSI